jgi:hypothetical protein
MTYKNTKVSRFDILLGRFEKPQYAKELIILIFLDMDVEHNSFKNKDRLSDIARINLRCINKQRKEMR